jgi:uncharacterized membrane-anchored protein YjiN (DUF445 family)
VKNKTMANKVLLFVAFLFLLAVALKYYYKGYLAVEVFYAVMEAALVGGIADWFAITAIFKKPLGFPWHTALIPRHRERVIRSIRDIIDQDLLTVQSIKNRVDASDLVSLLIGFVEDKRGKQLLSSWFEGFCKETINKLEVTDLVVYIDSFVKKEIHNSNLVSQIKNVIKWLLEQERVKNLTIYIVDELINQLEMAETKQIIYKNLEEITRAKSRSPLERAFIWLGEQTNSVSISEAAEAFRVEVLRMLQESKNPEHILHKKIYEQLTALLELPESDFMLLEQIESWKMSVVTDIDLGDRVVQMIENVLATANPEFYNQLMEWLTSLLHRYWEFFKENNEIQEWLEIRIKKAIYQIIEQEHYVIGEMVQRVLSEFTDDRLNHFVEEKAGDDLQWIRINGSVVGGVVGLVMFLFVHYFYDRYVVPIIQSWL